MTRNSARRLIAAALSLATAASSFAGVSDRPFYGPSKDGAPSMDALLKKYETASEHARENPYAAFDGDLNAHPSAFLQNFDADSIMNTRESPHEAYEDLHGRRYYGLQPGTAEHPKTSTLRRLGIAVLTPVLAPIVTPIAYASRKFDSNRPAAKTAGGLLGVVQHGVNVGLKFFGTFVVAPGIGFIQGCVACATRLWGAVKKIA